MTRAPGSGTGGLYTIEEPITGGRGPLDPTERAAAVAICARATSRTGAETLLAMLGLLRQPSPRQETTP